MPTVRRPEIDEVRAASELLGDVLVPTPLVPLTNSEPARPIWLKPETAQVVGSFKIRGVFNAVARQPEEVRRRGLSTVSAGNTAQALAWTGRHFGVESRSLMPEHAPRTKVDAVRRLGGNPVLVPRAEVFRFLKERLWEDEPYLFVHPWIDREVLIGHGTLALEIHAELPDVATIYVPVGGGGLLGGVGSALRALVPGVRIVAVEPEGCPSLHEAVRVGRPVQVECDTICDGVAVPYMTDEMLPLLADLADDVLLVSEDAVRRTVRRLAVEEGIVAEGAGALALAAALADEGPGRRDGPAVALVTGGSIDQAQLSTILADG
jgi:threonine dehydratase